MKCQTFEKIWVEILSYKYQYIVRGENTNLMAVFQNNFLKVVQKCKKRNLDYVIKPFYVFSKKRKRIKKNDKITPVTLKKKLIKTYKHT